MRAKLRPTIPANPISIEEILDCDPAQVTELRLPRSIKQLPEDISKLINLELLAAYSCGLTDLPSSMDQLTSLKTVWFDSNNFCTVPAVLREMKQIRSLSLSNNPIHELPVWLGDLSITGLYIEATQSEFKNYFNIPKLKYFGTSDVPGLCEFLRRHKYISDLSVDCIGENTLVAISEVCPRLSSLTVDSPSAPINHLRRIDGLTELRIRNASVYTMPKWIKNSDIQTLQISGKNAKVLPNWLNKMPALDFLDVRYSSIVDLPSSLGCASSLVNIETGSNCFKDPLASISEMGTGSIMSYLRSRSAGESVLHEAKLIFVGEGKVGKSTLAAALRGDTFINGRDTTHGIELGKLVLKRGRTDMTFNTWDFGGQEVYRITHQFFYSSQAVILLLWNPREGVEICQVEGWLRRLRTRLGTGARVILVATHAEDGRYPDIDWPALKREFGSMLIKHIPVDSRTGDNLKELKKCIADTAVDLRQMGGVWPTSWVNVRDALTDRRECEPFLSWSGFLSLCNEYGVCDAEQQGVLSKLLHELGHIIHFGDDETLKDTLILDAEWATKAISRVLEDKPTIEDGGILKHERLSSIWGKDGGDCCGFDRTHYPFFLRLMERFDASYRIVDSSGDVRRSLVAQRLPFERPAELPWVPEDTLMPGHRELRLTCEMSDEAPGLLPWLIVRTHRFTSGRHWRRGTYLHYPEHQSQALLEMLNDRELSLVVRAPHPDHFFTLLRDGFDTLIRERWPGLTATYRIPCPTRSDEGRCKGAFEIEDVKGYRADGIKDIQCHKCRKSIDVNLLLTGFISPIDPVEIRLGRIEAKVDGLTERAAELRRMVRALGDEARACPYLFTLVPQDRKVLNPRKLVDRSFKMTLWCTHPGAQHPIADATYTVTLTKEWFAKTAPYLGFTLRALRLIVPVGDAGALAYLDDASRDGIKDELNVMDKFVAALPTAVDVSDMDLAESRTPQHATGPLLQWLNATLREKDVHKNYGGLKPVVDRASGDLHWVCAEHLPEYDPGPVAL